MADDGPRGSWWQTLPGVLTAVAGVLSAVTGLVVALRDSPERPPPGPSGVAPPAAPAPAPMPGPPAAAAPEAVVTPALPTRGPSAGPTTAAQPPALAGTWRDQHGTVLQIRQSGERFLVVAEGINCAGTRVQGQGEGVVRDGRFETQFRTTTPSTGRCIGQLSADGRASTAHCVDSACGEYVSIGQRQ